MTAPRFRCALLFQFPPKIAQEILVMSFHDVMIVCFDLPGRKATVHVHQKHCCLSVHWPASTPESMNIIYASEPLRLFLSPNSMPVTLSPRYFGVLSYQSLDLFTHFQQSTGRYNKQTRMMDTTY